MNTQTAPHVIRAREAHHEALNQMLPANKRGPGSGLKTWRKLRMIEQQATATTTKLCNGEIDQDEAEQSLAKIPEAVADVFGGKLPPGFFINRDPRGYALKLEPGSVPFALHQDWGRYQILAPEIN